MDEQQLAERLVTGLGLFWSDDPSVLVADRLAECGRACVLCAAVHCGIKLDHRQAEIEALIRENRHRGLQELASLIARQTFEWSRGP